MESYIVARKLLLQENPTILFSDIDGTLFSPNLNLITAPIYNFQTSLFLKKSHIPFIIVTGRSFWRSVDQYHLKLLGLPQPDVVVTANGSAIYHKNGESYRSDFSWQGIMQSTKVTNSNGQSTSWNKWDITNTITSFLDENNFAYFLGRGNTYLIRIRFTGYKLKQIEKIRKDILALFPKGIRIILTEKLLWKNSLDIFSGEFLITPTTAGKDNAVAYLLKKFSMDIGSKTMKHPSSFDKTQDERIKKIHAFIFGDATVDIPMLTMKSDEKYFSLFQYLVHPTPMAEKIAKEKNISILFGDGPKEILWTLRPELRKNRGVTRLGDPQNVPAANNVSDANFGGEEGQDPAKLRLSPAQNNKARKVVAFFEKALDKIVDKELSPNEISFLGLTKLSHGLKLLHQQKGSFIHKTKGLYHYTFGNLTDILDGIRARNSDKKEENGQLVDGFADRAKEFMQLFQRAKNRLKANQIDSLQTFLSAVSCSLPSIARAQVEITGKTVSERDEKGGSMIDRTKRLFLSLLFTMVGLEDQSIAVDKKIYETNLATYRHRLTFAKKFEQNKINYEKLSVFEKKALERFLLYVDVLQQEDSIITKYLVKHQSLLKKYQAESSKLAKDYLVLNVTNLRKKWKIKDYKLKINKYI